jgi:RNA polymerase sigma-70 factor (ECF subfamily)
MNRLPAYGNAADEELVAWSAGGDRRAFDELVIRHGRYALRVAARLVRNTVIAEDLVQEAFVRCWSQVQQFDPHRARFTTWLYRQPEPLPEHFDTVDPAAGAEEMMECDERGSVLAQALNDLPVRQRAAMTLVYDEGLSGAEAARALGLSAKAVERLLARARAYLRARLQSRQLPESERC